MAQQNSILHRAYLVTIFVKGFDGALETLLGLIIAIFGSDRIYAFVIHVTAPELYDDRHSRAFQLIRVVADHLASGPRHFIITYLLIHGVLKLWIAVTLLRGGGRWIFPLASLILVAFIGVMGYRLSEQWSNWLLGFALFDAFTLALVLNEWRQPDRLAHRR
jgi:uncharacterized membrane protein